MPSSQQQQTSLTNFFSGGRSNITLGPKQSRRLQDGDALASVRVAPFTTAKKRRRMMPGETSRDDDRSRFGQCPLCEACLPWHRLESHAAICTGKPEGQPERNENHNPQTTKLPAAGEGEATVHDSTVSRRITPAKASPQASVTSIVREGTKNADLSSAASSPPLPVVQHPLLLQRKVKPSVPTAPLSSSEPLQVPPGLYVYPEFITLAEEEQLIQLLDDPTLQQPPWKLGRFNGQQCGKRWGVHCNLRDRRVDAPEHPLPPLFQSMLFPKLAQLECWDELAVKRKRKHPYVLVPNEANAIDYRRQRGDWLQAHVDDRKLSTEPIANLSLAGDCYMTFQNVRDTNNSYKVRLPRRTLLVLTGPARYNYTHAIANSDLLSDRRVSITMRESPLTMAHHPTTITVSAKK